MSDQQSIQAAMWVMMAVQTIGAIDLPGKGKRKMPSPHAYIIVVAASGILSLIADAGAGRAARAMAWLTVLTAAFVGPFGQRVLSFFNTLTSPPFVTGVQQSSTTPTTSNLQA